MTAFYAIGGAKVCKPTPTKLLVDLVFSANFMRFFAFFAVKALWYFPTQSKEILTTKVAKVVNHSNGTVRRRAAP